MKDSAMGKLYQDICKAMQEAALGRSTKLVRLAKRYDK